MKRKTAKKRFGRAVKRIAQWCCENRHRSVAEQHQALNRKLRGHYASYGVTGNARALSRFVRMTEPWWRYWLASRNHRAHMNWSRFKQLLHLRYCPHASFTLFILAQRILDFMSRMREFRTSGSVGTLGA